MSVRMFAISADAVTNITRDICAHIDAMKSLSGGTLAVAGQATHTLTEENVCQYLFGRDSHVLRMAFRTVLFMYIAVDPPTIALPRSTKAAAITRLFKLEVQASCEHTEAACREFGTRTDRLAAGDAAIRIASGRVQTAAWQQA